MLPACNNNRRHTTILCTLYIVKLYIHQVTDDKRRTPSLLRIRQILEGCVDVRAMMFRLERQQLTDDVQHVALTFLRRDKLLHLVGEEDHTHLIVVLNGGESECRGYFSDCVAFHLTLGTKVPTSADINQ